MTRLVQQNLEKANVEKSLYKLMGSSVGTHNRYHVYRLQRDWEVLVGRLSAMHSQPMEIRFKVLYVDVDSAPWANELLMLKEPMLQKLNAALGWMPEMPPEKRKLKDIRFRVQSKLERLSRLPVAEAGDVIPLPELTEKEQEEARRTVPALRHEKLRQRALSIANIRQRREKYLRKAGIPNCARCGAPVWGQGNLCERCVWQARQDERHQIAVSLLAEPWLTDEDLQKRHHCGKIIVTAVCEGVQDFYCSRVEEGTATAEEEMLAVLLKKRCRPEEISPVQRENVLRGLRGKQYVRAFGRKLPDTK